MFMMQADVVVIDYGIGNLLSVYRGFEYCGAKVDISNDPDVIRRAPRVVLPGVGAFANAMHELRNLQLLEVLYGVANSGSPFLGICLGMQLLLDESEEFGHTAGLGLIRGQVVPINSRNSDGIALKVPHIGWSELYHSEGRSDWCGSLIQDIQSGDSVYFTHSFRARLTHEIDCLSYCQYGDLRFPAVISRDNIHGCQFHPEKSGETGLKILSRFLKL